jgi:hypothetical protein
MLPAASSRRYRRLSHRFQVTQPTLDHASDSADSVLDQTVLPVGRTPFTSM